MKIFKVISKIGSKGATAIEYALIASLIAVVAISAMRTIGNGIKNRLNYIANELTNDETPGAG